MSITKSVGFGSTPSSNTGSFPPFPLITTQLDWLQGVVKLTPSQFDTLVGEISNTFKDTFAADGGHLFTGRSFEHHRISDRGGRVAWNVQKFDDHEHHLGDRHIDCWLMLPAGLLNGCDSTYSLRRFLSMLQEWEFKPTRIDLALDDYSKSLTWQNFDDARKAGHAHGFKKGYLAASFGDKLGDGFTYYMGSKGSDKMHRFYNKYVESNGEIDALRLEPQFRDDWCKSVWACLLESDTDEKFHQTIVNCVCEPIDFRDENDVPLQWWADFKKMCKAEVVNLSCGRVKTTLEKSMDWVEVQVETTLAMIEDFCDKTSTDFTEWLNARLESGRSKLRSIHQNRVDSACKVLSEISNSMNFYYQKFGEYPLYVDF